VSKKTSRKRPGPEKTRANEPTVNRPLVFFAIGDAEFGYTEGKILRLAQRFQKQTQWNLVVLTHDTETFEEIGRAHV